MTKRMLRTEERKRKGGLQRKRGREIADEKGKGEVIDFCSLWCLWYLCNHAATLIQPIWLNCIHDKGKREEEIHAYRDKEFQEKRVQKEQQIERKTDSDRGEWSYWCECTNEHVEKITVIPQVLMNAENVSHVSERCPWLQPALLPCVLVKEESGIEKAGCVDVGNIDGRAGGERAKVRFDTVKSWHKAYTCRSAKEHVVKLRSTQGRAFVLSSLSLPEWIHEGFFSPNF